MRFRLLIQTGLALLVLWGVAWGLNHWVWSTKPTPEKLLAYLETRPLEDNEDSGNRREVVLKVADMLNGLDNAQMSQLFSKAAQEPDADTERRWRQDFFESMTPEEERLFMERRVGKAFDQLMNAFNEMSREERKTMVNRSLKQMREDSGRQTDLQRLEAEDAALAERVVNEGLRAYYQQASAETKLDLAPLLEQMQQNLGAGGRRFRAE